MSQLKDPGKDKPDKAARKEARMKAWKRPSSEKERKEKRAERMADWEAR